MRDGETIEEMFGRLQTLLNGLQALGYEYTKAQINLKILDNFPKVGRNTIGGSVGGLL